MYRYRHACARAHARLRLNARASTHEGVSSCVLASFLWEVFLPQNGLKKPCTHPRQAMPHTCKCDLDGVLRQVIRSNAADGLVPCTHACAPFTCACTGRHRLTSSQECSLRMSATHPVRAANPVRDQIRRKALLKDVPCIFEELVVCTGPTSPDWQQILPMNDGIEVVLDPHHSPETCV